jgi:type IV pilus assembly protein PilM
MFSDNLVIGLDIGSQSIKMVEIKNTPTGKELQTFGLANHNLALDGFWDNKLLRQLAQIIEEIMKVNHFNGVKTVISVMSKDVYVTTMDFESTWDKNRINTEIERQSPYFLPYPPDEMRLSWKEITVDDEIIDFTGKQRVSIKALPKFVIENSKNLLEYLNLDGIVLENQTESQVRSLLYPDSGNTILMDVGSKQTTFNIIIDGVLRSSAFIPVGSNQITADLSNNLGVEEETADFFKKDLQLINLMQLPKPFTDFMKVIKTELNSFVDLNRKIGQSPNKIVMTGGGIYTAGFWEFFSSYELPVYLGNALRQIILDEEFKQLLSPVNNQFSTAIGLAMWDETMQS